MVRFPLSPIHSILLRQISLFLSSREMEGKEEEENRINTLKKIHPF
jgi:hypothetical protein